MSTLAEIEAAAAKLSISQKEALVERLLAQLRSAHEESSPSHDLSEFSGILRLGQDPLERQHRIRGEWG